MTASEAVLVTIGAAYTLVLVGVGTLTIWHFARIGLGEVRKRWADDAKIDDLIASSRRMK